MSVRKIRTCLIDDHPMMLQGLAAVLADNPKIEVVATILGGRAAMEAFSSVPIFDVAIVDLRMSDIDGFEIIKTITSSLPDTKTLAYSALDSLASIRKALACGAAGFVHKSADVNLLAEAIERIYAGNTFFCSLSRELILSDLKYLPYQSLTAREREIFELLKLGRSNKKISDALFISYPTVRFHIKNIYRKLGVSERSRLPE